MNETVSVLIITRNRALMLKNCLESLAKQTLLPDEVLVVYTSTDNTKNVILSFKKRLPIKYFEEKQVGIPYARNRGIKEASGTLLLMLDDDCVADKFWVERMVEAHRKYPKAWAIQGRTYSLPKDGMYSLVSEFSSLLYVRNYAKKIVPLNNFLSKYFLDEIEILTCETRNLSFKTSYLRKHKLSFDTEFYRGEDTDLGKQILQKNGLIIFYPHAAVGHWERSNLKEFLEQQWHIGRTTAKIKNKWRNFSAGTFLSWPEKFVALLLFCNFFYLSQWYKLPIFLMLLFLSKLYRLNGWFYEKRAFSLEKHI